MSSILNQVPRNPIKTRKFMLDYGHDVIIDDTLDNGDIVAYSDAETDKNIDIQHLISGLRFNRWVSVGTTFIFKRW